MAPSQVTCLICLSVKKNTINLHSDNGKKSNIISILSTHFWFNLDEINTHPNICNGCWMKTKSFHELYQSSRISHKKFETVFVKIEEDLDIVDVEGTYQLAEVPVQGPHDNCITELFKIENIEEAEEDDESSNASVCEIPQTDSIDTETRAFDSLTKKTQKKYLQTYRKMLAWKSGENIDEECFSEAVMLEFFHYLKSKYKPSTLWAHYTMLRTTIQRNHNIDISYPEVTSLLKKSAVGYRSQKYFFQANEIQQFFSEARDFEFLAIKVIMIFLISGITRTDDLVKVGVKDVVEQGTVFVIKIPEKKTNSIRSYTVENEYAACIRKYIGMRPSHVTHDQFFLTYLKGKCTIQTVGKTKFRNAPKAIARFLKLKDAESYTCFSFGKESISNKRKIEGPNSEKNNVETSSEAAATATVTSSSLDSSDVVMASVNANEICEDEEATSLDTLPEKSRQKYIQIYDYFMVWKTNEKIDKDCFSKAVMLKYLSYLKTKYKPTSLWARYSMLRATIQKSHNIDIADPEIKSFLKTSSFAYLPRKCAAFRPDEIQRFLSEAADDEFLAFKVVTIFGICGQLHADELIKLDVSDVIEQGSVFVIKIPDTKTNGSRSFTVENEYATYVQKYKELRPKDISQSAFFLTYLDGKCTAQPISKNKILRTSKVIANFLKLKDPENYSLLSFRQKPLKRGLNSSSVLGSNTEEGIRKKRKTGEVNSKKMNSETSTETNKTSVNTSSVENGSTTATATNVCEDVEASSWDLLPEKSRVKYVRKYEKFLAWKSDKRIDRNCFSESVMLEYFNQMKPLYKPTSLWVEYSMLKATIQKNDDIDISRYSKLKSLLRITKSGYVPLECNVFQQDEIRRFLNEAEDNEYLALKVIMIFGIHGATTPHELARIEVDDVVEKDTATSIKITDTKTNIINSFTLEEEYATYVHKYKLLRPENVDHKRFFIHYENGKCTAVPIGKKRFRFMHKAVANFLDLDDANNYGSHSFRQTYKKSLADDAADTLTNAVEEPIGNNDKNNDLSMDMDTSNFSNILDIPATFETYHVQPHQVKHPPLYLPFSTSSHN